MALTLADITRVYNDEAGAYLLLESIRWPDGPICPHCGTVDDAHYMEPKGEGRKDRHGKIQQRRLWRCHSCKKQFSVLVNTIFGDSHIPLGKWLMGFHEICSAKNGISAHELSRKLEITVKSGWFMAHRIRYAMARQPLSDLLSGTVEVDETYMGGKPRKHLSRSEAAKRRHDTKTPVVTLVQRKGEVRSQVMKPVTGKNIRKVLVDNVAPNATVMTDESNIYAWPLQVFASHEHVNHRTGEYARGAAHINSAEGYFSQLKRSIDGTHHWVSEKHLARYLANFDWMYNTRDAKDAQRATMTLMRTAGKRLYYKQPTSTVE
jgi:transposase-like protein